MVKKLIDDAKEAAIASDRLVKDIMNFVEKNIIKIDIQEGPLLKEARKVVAQGLRNIAEAVENPQAEIKWVDLKKDKSKK